MEQTHVLEHTCMCVHMDTHSYTVLYFVNVIITIASQRRRNLFTLNTVLLYCNVCSVLFVSREKKKKEGASSTIPARVETLLDKDKAERRVAARLAVQKHRASHHPNKKRSVLE